MLRTRFKLKIGGSFVAGQGCPVVSGDKIYMVNEAGQILILAAGPEFNLLAELTTGNRDEVYWSTPVIVGDSFGVDVKSGKNIDIHRDCLNNYCRRFATTV